MEGIKEFTNKSCVDCKVTLIVRAGDRPGCVLKKEEFCIKACEKKCICFGNKCNPFLDGIRVCSAEDGQLVETICATTCSGNTVDKLLNCNDHIVIINAGPCLVITGTNC